MKDTLSRILYNIFLVLCWHLREIPDGSRSLHAAFEVLRHCREYIDDPEERVLAIRLTLESSAAEILVSVVWVMR